MARANERIRLAYHARLLLVAISGAVGGTMACAAIGWRGIGATGVPAVALAFGVLAYTAWLGWIDYQSGLSLKIDGAGISLAGRRVPWSGVRGVTRATGPFRLALRTDAGVLRFQLLVVDRPIHSLKLLVTEAASAGAKVDPYLVRLAELAEEDET